MMTLLRIIIKLLIMVGFILIFAGSTYPGIALIISGLVTDAVVVTPASYLI